jgi:hypothetical protein
VGERKDDDDDDDDEEEENCRVILNVCCFFDDEHTTRRRKKEIHRDQSIKFLMDWGGVARKTRHLFFLFFLIIIKK